MRLWQRVALTRQDIELLDVVGQEQAIGLWDGHSHFLVSGVPAFQPCQFVEDLSEFPSVDNVHGTVSLHVTPPILSVLQWQVADSLGLVSTLSQRDRATGASNHCATARVPGVLILVF